MIMALQSDPQIRAVLTDPAFLALITSGNLQADPGESKVSGTPATPGAEGHPGARPLAGWKRKAPWAPNSAILPRFLAGFGLGRPRPPPGDLVKGCAAAARPVRALA